MNNQGQRLKILAEISRVDAYPAGTTGKVKVICEVEGLMLLAMAKSLLRNLLMSSNDHVSL